MPRLYSLAFVVLVLALLASFLISSGGDLSLLSDQFHWRTELVQLYNGLRWNMGDRLFNLTIRAKDGWLMYSGDWSIPDYQRTDPLTDEQLGQLQTGLDNLNALLQKQGRTLLVVIPPNKNTIYGQYMPAEVPVLGKRSRLGQFLAYMRLKGKTQVLDLRPALLQASRSQQVYYRIDSHWTDEGAYIAYAEIMKALSTRYPDLQARPLADFDRTQAMMARDIVLAAGLGKIREQTWQLVPRSAQPPDEVITDQAAGSDALVRFISRSNSTAPSLLIFHDSFFDVGLSKFLEPHFSRIVEVANAEQPGIWSADWVKTQPTDIVIIEITERLLLRLFPLLAGYY